MYFIVEKNPEFLFSGFSFYLTVEVAVELVDFVALVVLVVLADQAVPDLDLLEQDYLIVDQE